MKNTAKPGLRLATLIGIIIMTQAQFCQAFWPPDNVDITPPSPSPADLVTITLSGEWIDFCVPVGSSASVIGNDIYFDVTAHAGTCMLFMAEPWQQSQVVGPLAGGTYTVHARLLGEPGEPETYSQVAQFNVPAILHVPSQYATIQAAIDAANTGDTVIVAPGTYTPIDPGFGPIGFYIWKDITVRSTDPCDPCVVAATIIDAQGSVGDSRRGFIFSNVGPNAVLAGLTITGGAVEGAALRGAAIECDNASPTISKCVIRDNGVIAGCFCIDDSHGGAIHCGSNSSPLITDCIIKNNTSYWGGGAIDCDGGGNPTIVDSIIEGNSSSWGVGGVYGSSVGLTMSNCIVRGNRGGGILCQGSNSTISYSTIEGNTANVVGGGIYCKGGSPNIDHCIIRNNTGPSSFLGGAMGGGITCDDSSPNISNCIITENFADGYFDTVWYPGNGGGVLSAGTSNPRITNCVLWGNVADVEGGAVYGSAIIENSILWGNSPDEIVSGGGTVVVSYSDIQGGWAGAGNIATNPWFVDLNTGDYHLVAASDCVDTGSNSAAAALTTDLDGNPRIINGIVDMGPYECQTTTLYVDNDATEDPGPNDPGISDPNENGTPAHPFDDIQEAMNFANNGHTISLAPGDYLAMSPLVEKSINFGGKNITLTGADPLDWGVVNSTIIGGYVVFDGSEEPNCVLTGLTIRHLSFGAIYGNGTQATISYCNISGNAPCGATVIDDCDGEISNCLVTDNGTVWACGIFPVIAGCDGTIKNCTIANNISGVGVGDATITNSIIYLNDGFQVAVDTGATADISYSNIAGGLGGIVGAGSVNWDFGNIDADPCFVRLGEWVMRPLAPELQQGDYHVKSQGWRRRNDMTWTYDSLTSRCIDAGNPGSPLGAEAPTALPDDPNNDRGVNLRINMGAMGGTNQAGIGPHNWALLSDINNDGTVNLMEFDAVARDWQTQADELSTDFNRDGTTNMIDFIAVTQEWLLTTSWSQ